MFIFLTNAPREYAWGSTNALPELMGVPSTGKPQAEVWFGSHAGDPAQLAKASPAPHTLIDLIEADPEQYGVAGGRLPFLMKVLAIGGPLSLQVHPNAEQAAAGYAHEVELGMSGDDPRRNYGDPHHKPELLVALTEVTALSGFRELKSAREDVLHLAQVAQEAGSEVGAAALREAGHALAGEPAAARARLLAWALSGEHTAVAAVEAIDAVLAGVPQLSLSCELRVTVLRELVAAYPRDGGVLVSLLLHVVRLAPGEAIYLGAQQLHAYLSGMGLEIMAASDNVLRAGLTQKRVDVAELLRVVSYDELEQPRFAHRRVAAGVVEWQPPVPDFRLLRVSLSDAGEFDAGVQGVDAEQTRRVVLRADSPMVAVVTSGTVRLSRQDGGFDEMAAVRRGQCVYISVGEPVELAGSGEVFVGMVGEWQ